jgi:hypothetical protein
LKRDVWLENCDNNHKRRKMARSSHVQTKTIIEEKQIKEMAMECH